MKNKRKRGFSATVDSWLFNLSRTGRSSKQALSILVDSTVVMASLWAAYSLRLSTSFTDFSSTWHLFVLLPIVTTLAMASLGIYRWVVRSSNRVLFYQLGKACLISSLALALLSFLLPPDRANPRSIFIIYGLLVVIGTFSVRFLWQSWFDSGKRGEPVAIYGAGHTGVLLAQSLNQGNKYRPVLMLDDNPALAGTTVSGNKVVTPTSDGQLEALLGMHDIGRVIMALPSINPVEYESKIQLIKGTGLPVQTIPTYAELVSGDAELSQVRDISISDILGRSEVPADLELLGKCVTDQVVLVTGAGGSIGSELCRQIIKQQPAKLIAIDHSEENLYKLSEEMTVEIEKERLSQNDYVAVLCSVNDAESVSEVMASYAVNTVYHAAAYKHVPIVEAQPEQGVRVNIFGTLCVLDAAISNKVNNFVLISTDKAVRPTNAMGATKRAAELVLQAKARIQSDTRISMVRFGNVLGSSGSVVPKFKKQIESGGPITLTDPDITRYFMTIPEAAQLVLQASAIAKGGDVFVLDMGDPVRIVDLANSMVRMSGRQLYSDTGNNKDIKIEVLGLRPGEKMYEELFITEVQGATAVKKVFTAEEAWMEWDELRKKLDALLYLDSRADRPELRSRLLELAFYGETKKEVSSGIWVDKIEPSEISARAESLAS